MEILEKLFKKDKKIVVGLMSGTSADGIDAVVVEIKGNSEHTKVKQLAFETYKYPCGFKEFLLENSNSKTARLENIARLDFLVAHFLADAVKRIVTKANLKLSDIDLIGSHGQTICHLPDVKKIFGKKIRSTMQIGNPSVIAKLTGVITIGDFRVGDIAVGGCGAPLVPLFDYLFLRSKKKNRMILNIGGISNITVLPKNCSIDEVIAFDTGPGNMIIDCLMKRFYNKQFDKEGQIAMNGEIIFSLLRWLLSHPYLKLKPPKSTGREMFGDDFVKLLLSKYKKKHKENIITTVSEYTALCIYESYLKFVRKQIEVDELIVSGGGVYNNYIMKSLKSYFSETHIRIIDELNVPSDAKEAMCFALLANETISGKCGNVPNATGAKQSTILGAICLP